MATKKKLLICVPLGEVVHPIGFANYYGLLTELSANFETEVEYCFSESLSVAKNLLVEKAAASDADYVLFLDMNLLPKPNDIVKLVSHDKDASSALFFDEIDGSLNFMILSKKGHLLAVANFPQNQLLKVGAIKLGCAVFKRQIFTELLKKEPHFIMFDHQDSGGQQMHEDIYFSTLLRNNGYEFFVDTSVIVRKYGALVDFNYYQAGAGRG